MMQKVEGWPVVLPDDDGIRPAGKPNECFYCGSKIGELHAEDCVCVYAFNRYDVYEQDPDTRKRGRLIGHWDHYDPWFWDSEKCDFHKNRSSWCKANAENIVFLEPTFAQWYEEQSAKEGTCVCPFLQFEYNQTVNDGPFVELREPDAPEQIMINLSKPA